MKEVILASVHSGVRVLRSTFPLVFFGVEGVPTIVRSGVPCRLDSESSRILNARVDLDDSSE